MNPSSGTSKIGKYIKTKEKKLQKRKRNRESSFKENGEIKKDTILTSDNEKSNSNLMCSCPVVQVTPKKKRCCDDKKKKKTRGGKAKSLNSKNHDALGVETDHEDLSSDGLENTIKNNEVEWEGYSPLHRITSGTNFSEVERLIKMGYRRTTGRWSTNEIEQLTRNLEEFLDNNKVIDYKGLILNRTKADHMYRKKTQFVSKMCPGIFRTALEIDRKTTDHFGKLFFKTGRFSLEEIKEFKRLHSLYGRDWKKIGLLLGRNANWMYRVCHEYEQSWNKEKWSLEEEKILLSSAIDSKDKNGRISWKYVSKRVQTRSQAQCRTHWSRFFSEINDEYAYEEWVRNIYNRVQVGPTHSNKEVLNFSDQEVKKLITIISDLDIDDEFLIDWNELTKQFDNVPSAAWLKLKFQAVCKEVPHSHRLEFPELIEQLMDMNEKKVSKDVDLHTLGEPNDDIQIIEEKDDVIEIYDTTDDDNDDDDDDDDIQIIE